MADSIVLKILLPFRVFLMVSDVRSVTADTSAGSYGFLPQRMDCAAILVPGIFVYQTSVLNYIGVNAGVMVKTGNQILVSVRNAVQGSDLVELNEMVEKQFLNINHEEKIARSIGLSMEAGLIRNLLKVRNS